SEMVSVLVQSNYDRHRTAMLEIPVDWEGPFVARVERAMALWTEEPAPLAAETLQGQVEKGPDGTRFIRLRTELAPLVLIQIGKTPQWPERGQPLVRQARQQWQLEERRGLATITGERAPANAWIQPVN